MTCIQFSTVLVYLHVSHGHVGGTGHCSENTDAVNMPLNFGLGVEERCIWILILWWNKKVDSSSNWCKIKLTFWEEEPVVCHFVPDLVPVCVQHPNDSIVVTNSSIDYHVLSLPLRMENISWWGQLKPSVSKYSWRLVQRRLDQRIRLDQRTKGLRRPFICSK